MKTIQDIREEIEETKTAIRQAESIGDRKNKSLAKKLRAQLLKLNSYLLFLETNPTEEYCKRSAETLTQTINRIIGNYEAQYGKQRHTVKMKTSFLKDLGVPKLRQQLSQVKYLLS